MRQRKIDRMTEEEMIQFSIACKEKGIHKVAKDFKMRGSDACELQKRFIDGYVFSVKNHNRKLSKYQVIKILIEKMKYGARNVDLAEKYGVSPTNIYNICRGFHWKHVFQGVKEKYNKEILSVK
jgi:Mor family transcriptional regulator